MKLTAKTKICCALLAGAFAYGTAAVPAQAAGEVAFAYHAGELASEAGARALHQRIRIAAGRACAGRSDLERAAARRLCRARIEGQLIARIGDPRLARIAGFSAGTAVAASR